MPIQSESKVRLHFMLKAHFAELDRAELRVLEAGGGAATRIPLQRPARFTVIDACPQQLASNDYASEKIQADLHDVDLSGREFDLVVCWNVLEHLRDPGRVAARLAGAVASGGAFVIASPNPLSLAGLVTKFTPHWVHDLFHVHLLRTHVPGGSGFRPFRTHMRWAMRADALRKQFAGAGLEIAFCEKYESSRGQRLQQRSPFFGVLHDAVLATGRAAALGRWRAELSDYFLVAVRPANVAAFRTSAARLQARAASA